MDFAAKTLDIATQHSHCLVIPVYQGQKPQSETSQSETLTLSEAGKCVDQSTEGMLTQVIQYGDMSAKAGSSLMVYDPPGIAADRVLLLGMGAHEELSEARLSVAMSAAVKKINQAHIAAADFMLLRDYENAEIIKRYASVMAVAAGEAVYKYQETFSSKKPKPALKRLNFIGSKENLNCLRKGLEIGAAIADGLKLTKTLSNLPGNICTPSYLAKRAQELAKSHALKTTILDEKQMAELKMDALLSVSKGSREPARLIIMEYGGGKRDQPPVVLVGKGLTFDAGGISIKPSAAMDEMKYDMCGGASVFGAMLAVAQMKLPLNVVGIVPSSENLPDGAANKPGDIVTSMAGKTIEILNTDAEGRLILCDALTYAMRYKPAAVIDIATLTGACVIALGHHASGLFSNNARLAAQVIAAGDKSGDRVWQLPLWDDYTRQLKSNFADLANIGSAGAGSITAACFLAEFTESYPWVHLDVAGTAWKSAGPKGATGRPLRLLVEFLMGYVHDRTG